MEEILKITSEIENELSAWQTAVAELNAIADERFKSATRPTNDFEKLNDEYLTGCKKLFKQRERLRELRKARIDYLDTLRLDPTLTEACR